MTNSHCRFQVVRWQMLAAAGALAVGLCLVGPAAHAIPVNISAAVGGVPTGTHYENFDSLTLGSAGGTTTSGVIVSFSPDGQAVQGSVSGHYAAPYLSNHNGTLFGDLSNGPDATTYLTTGLGNATLMFPTMVQYVGLLWGSVDSYNTLMFYNGATLISSITGDDITGAAVGNQGAAGTFYVNINSSLAFDRVVATSSEYAFEFDNLAFNETPIGVSEPGAAGLFLLGLALLGVGCGYRRRKLA